MFDPKVLLDAIMTGSARPAAAPSPAESASGGGLADILRKLGAAAGQGGGDMSPESHGGSQGASQGGQTASGLGEVLGQIFGQARQGVGEGAGRVDQMTGASQKIDELLRQVTGGQGAPETIDKLKKLIAENQLGAGAVAGALGALVLGTKTGRGVAASAAKAGSLVLIGGLAYKAYQNYSQGKPPLGEATAGTGGTGTQGAHHPAPGGSGFEPSAQTGDHALLYLRAMIAAANADGQIDAAEQQRILGGLEQLGLGGEATQFLRNEVANPATVQDLVAAAKTPEAGLQVYTAARLTIVQWVSRLPLGCSMTMVPMSTSCGLAILAATLPRILQAAATHAAPVSACALWHVAGVK